MIMAKRTDGCTYILLSIFITSHDVGSLLDQRNKISRYSKHLPINPDRDYTIVWLLMLIPNMQITLLSIKVNWLQNNQKRRWINIHMMTEFIRKATEHAPKCGIFISDEKVSTWYIFMYCVHIYTYVLLYIECAACMLFHH